MCFIYLGYCIPHFWAVHHACVRSSVHHQWWSPLDLKACTSSCSSFSKPFCLISRSIFTPFWCYLTWNTSLLQLFLNILLAHIELLPWLLRDTPVLSHDYLTRRLLLCFVVFSVFLSLPAFLCGPKTILAYLHNSVHCLSWNPKC